MARRRKQKTKKHRDIDPEDVLAGRVDISPEDLFRLIHRVNPTGRDLGARQEKRLYDLKSRLQSLLVRRHRELVTVEPAAEEGVASLNHRSGFMDACHAVVAELDTDARSWVRHELDLAAHPEVPDELSLPSARAEDDGEHENPGALIARAESAVSDYEYDVAERSLVAALELSGGAPEAARPLLELWVEALGMDGEALAVQNKLNARAREDLRVRSLLALAAARLGETSRALDLARGIPAVRAAAVHTTLAQGAVAGGDLEAAERHLAETEILDSSQPQLDEVRRAVAELVADDVRPAEEALAELHRRDGALAAEAGARQLLERWSQSEVARRVLHEVGDIRRRREIDDALEHAENALAGQRFRDAERYFRAALAAGSDREGLAEAADDARRQAEEHEDEERLAAVLAAFTAGDEHAAHVAYLALPAPLRERAAARIDRPTLAWLAEAAAPPSGQRAHVAAEAVLALERAATLDEPRRVAAELAPHQKSLRGVADAQRLMDEAERHLAERRRRRARINLGAARRAADDEQLEALASLLDDLDAGDLDAEGRATYEELRQLKASAEEKVRLEAERKRFLAEDDLLGARDRSRQLAEIAVDEISRQRWRKLTEDLREEIRAEWAVEIDGDERPLAEIRSFHPKRLHDHFKAWIDDDGNEMVLAEVKGFWLFIHVVDLRRRCVVERISMRPPALLPPINAWREEDVVRFVDEAGNFVELARHGWEVLRCEDLRDLLGAGTIVSDILPVPGSSQIWLTVGETGGERILVESCVVVDLETLRSGRQHPVKPEAVLFRPDGPHVACRNGDLRIFDGRGVEIPGWRRPMALSGTAVRPDPLGSGLLPPREDEEDRLRVAATGDLLLLVEELPRGEGAVLKLCREAASEASEHILELPGYRARDVKQLAVNSDERVAHLLVGSQDGDSELLAVRVSEERIDELYRLPFAGDAAFVQDRRGSRLFAVQSAADHLRIEPLGVSPPSPRAVGRPLDMATDSEEIEAAIQAADRALAAGDYDAAAARIDRPAVWAAREVQSAARLAAAYLEPAETPRSATPAYIFSKRQSLAFFKDVHRETDPEKPPATTSGLGKGSNTQRRRSLDMTELAWDREKLDELAEEADEWLSSQTRL